MARALRIFISSPGDVIPERRRAQLVIEKLAKSYARFFAIESILWEAEPMLASGHFQDQITPPGETDIVVLIVWSKLGTVLPGKTAVREYFGIDGRVPVTGTEWEFENAIAAQKKRGAPDLLAYRKTAERFVSLQDEPAMAAAKEQLSRLEAFWSRWFVDRGQFRAAFGEFADLDAFEEKLERDLRKLIETYIAKEREQDGAGAPVWPEGSPFRGLETFGFEHARIFFGRSATTTAAVEQLAVNAESGRAFLLILGASGSGKSSLAQAGVLPALVGRGIVSGVGLWRHAIIRPGGPAGPFAALAEGLVGAAALPELATAGQDANALARHLRAASDDPTYSLVAVLDRIERDARTRGELRAIETARLALVVDQLEELFTASEVTPEDRVAFTRCLDGLARSGRVFVIATMRSDYWHRASETPLLVTMAAGQGRLDLLPPASEEIVEMVRQPALAAGLLFETDPARRVGLDAVIESEAQTEPGTLPLLSFLLDQLYQKDVADRHGTTLTFSSMRELGGLKGAIAQRADAAMAALPAVVQAALPKVLRALVVVSGSAAEPTSRPAPQTLFPEGSDARRLIDAFLDPQVRLLIAEGDGEGARFRIAHEALFTHWGTAREVLARSRGDLELRSRLEQAALLWSRTGDDSRLLGEGTPLDEAEDLLARYPDDVSRDVRRYVAASRTMWDIVNAGRPSKRDLRLDLFMGLALWFIFLDHVPGSVLGWASIKRYGFSDATEIFVFISGYFAASQYAPMMRELGWVRTSLQILKRGFQAYVAYIFLFALYMAEITYVAATFDNPLYSEEMGVFDFLKQPDMALIQSVLLKYAPLNLDVLQLYIPLMVVLSPVLWVLLRRPNLMMALSAALYAASWVGGWQPAAYPSGTWVLNPIAWQMLFVFGAWCGTGGAARLAPVIRSKVLLTVSALYIVASALVAIGPPAAMPPWLTGWILPIDKTNLDIVRVAHFLALAVLAVRFVPRDWGRLKGPFLRPAVLCGQHPLEIFCLGVLLSFAGHFLMVEISDAWLTQVFVGIAGITLMITAAMLMAAPGRGRLAQILSQPA